MSNFRELKKTLKRPEGPIQHFNAEVERAMEEMEAEDKEFAELEREFEEESRMPRARIGKIQHFNAAVERSMEEMEAEDREFAELEREFEEEFRMPWARIGTTTRSSGCLMPPPLILLSSSMVLIKFSFRLSGIQHFNAAEESRTPRARIGSIHHFNEAVERSMEEMEAEDKEFEELQREFEEEFRMERARMGTAPEVVDAAAWHGNGAPRAAGGGLRRPRDTHPEAYWHQRR
ncbi:unnamed protein product [Linum tenue]|uniref:Uncharacterized protein n=1 Tax=Linum tenue TaxID=586396 RepID=A0AAV0HU63_9ROSI|nr:unnamed protein product [Linum tenue]